MNQTSIRFTKMHGAGNDFVLVSALEEDIILSRQQIARLCDRRFGVGADGLMILRKSSQAGADVRMSYYNSDGGEAEMCGNGARCFARFAKRELDWNKPRITIQTGAGLVAAEYEGELVRLMMTPPRDWRAPFLIQALGENFSVAFVNTGVPHAVMQVNDLEKLDVRSLGSAIRHHSEFAPSGTNANFFAFAADGAILLRTYERGVEDETLACGTGVVATALVAHRYYGGTMPASIRVRGGDYLRVETSESGQVFLIGPATFVFEGELQPGVI